MVDEKKCRNSKEELLSEVDRITLTDIREHITGPVISTIVHIVLLSFLGTIIVFEAPKKSRELTIEMKTIKPKEIKPPPPPPEPPEPVETNNVDDVPIQTPDVNIDLDVKVDNISTEEISDVELPNALNMKLTNSALKLAVPVGSGGGHKGGVKIGGLGYKNKADGDLTGVLYDLKTTPSKGNRGVNYWKDIADFIDNGFKPPNDNPFRKINKKLYNSHFYIPSMPASEGPKQFDAEKEMEPSGFFVHYTGKIHVDKEFKFAGMADDMLIVLIDKKVVFDGSWNEKKIKGFQPPEPKRRFKSFIGWQEEFGTWVKPGNHRIDILFGERPGGVIGGALLVEEKGKTYKKGLNDHPILPIFKTMRLNKEEKDRIKSEKWEIAIDGPAMGCGKVKVKKEKEVKGLTVE